MHAKHNKAYFRASCFFIALAFALFVWRPSSAQQNVSVDALAGSAVLIAWSLPDGTARDVAFQPKSPEYESVIKGMLALGNAPASSALPLNRSTLARFRGGDRNMAILTAGAEIDHPAFAFLFGEPRPHVFRLDEAYSIRPRGVVSGGDRLLSGPDPVDLASNTQTILLLSTQPPPFRDQILFAARDANLDVVKAVAAVAELDVKRTEHVASGFAEAMKQGSGALISLPDWIAKMRPPPPLDAPDLQAFEIKVSVTFTPIRLSRPAENRDQRVNRRKQPSDPQLTYRQRPRTQPHRVQAKSDRCVKSGYGPGHSVICGPDATTCDKTGYGPGNAVACGGRADRCEKTGYGAGNAVACGGLADSCEKTGYGPGNAVACGGLADSCDKTGYGPGNAVACGGRADRCEKTGYGPGNAVACGRRADRCEKTGYGPGNAVACGGLADRCEKTGYGPGNHEACGGRARR